MPKKINVSELDFDRIKESLKNFLREQSNFADFDYEGSNMAVLLDVLAYNTYYNAIYTNMAINEAFLDSASKRNSVVSIAKSLGYLPRSASCARAVINFTVSGTNTLPDFLTIAKNTSFYGTKDGESYNFYIPNDITVPRSSNNTYIFSNVELIEGEFVREVFQYTQKNVYALQNTNIDLSTLRVTVQETPTSTNFKVFQRAETLANIEGDDLVYFIKEIDNGFYEINFGDNIVGKALEPGNLITVEYYVSSGSKANKIKVFSYGGSTIFGGNVTQITTVTPANGGTDPEDIESIRFNAPIFWQAQNRAITADDYKSILLAKVPLLKDVYVWGGEKNDPPVYGKVFIAVNTVSGQPLRFEEKEYIKRTILDQYRNLTVIPEFVDPEFINIHLDLVVYYDPSLTNKTPSDIQSLLISEYDIYNEEKLKFFGKSLRNSEIIQIAENIDQAITNVIPRLKLSLESKVFFNIKDRHIFKFYNPIVENTPSVIQSSGFKTDRSANICFLDNDEEGNINLFSLEDGIKTYIAYNIGKIEYKKGIIQLYNEKIISAIDDKLIIYALPSSSDVVSFGNKIVHLDMSKLKISVIADQTNNNNYYFADNRLKLDS